MGDKKDERVVTSIKMSSNPLENTYTLVGEKVSQTKSTIQLELYENIAPTKAGIDIKGKVNEQIYEDAMSRLIQRIGIDDNINELKSKLKGSAYEEVALKMIPELKKVAHLLLRGFLSGAPIVVRFHNDGDGSGGAIALYRALADLQKKFFEEERAISWEMNRSIAYNLESFYADKMLFESYECIERPIILITDFGTSQESIEALKASQGTCEIIWLDHHMPYDGFPRQLAGHYLNVCDFGGASSFTAGLLTCIFAQILSDVDVEDVKQAALVSDYSIYADFKNVDAANNALILDYLTSSSNDMYHKPKQMDIILKDKEKSESTYRHASGLLKEALDTGLKNIRRYKNSDGLNICVLDFGHIAKLRLDYPLPGRYSSRLQEKLERENGGKTITIVHYGSYISMRTSGDIQESISILDIIEKLKIATNGAVSGGGHRQAASLRTDREHIKEAMRLLLLELGVRIDE